MTSTGTTETATRRNAFVPALLGVLVLGLAMTTVYQLGRTHRLRTQLAEARRALDAARRRAEALEAELRVLQAQQEQSSRKTEQLRSRVASRPPQAPPATQPAAPRATQPAKPPDEPHLLARLNAILQPDADGFRLSDPAAGRALLATIRGRLADLKLDDLTWARLALLAALLDDPLADELAARAGQAPAALAPVWRIRAQAALARGRWDEARPWTRRLVESEAARDRDWLLEALAAAGTGDWLAAAEAFDRIDPQRLDREARIAWGRLCVALERWDALERVLAMLEPATTQPADAVTFLRAVAVIHDGKADEGRALIETLLTRDPDSYELRVWRAIALIESGQFEAAREALRFAEQQPTRPEAWYWRAMVEIRSGNEDAAAAFLSEALGASESYAPAWEALGVLALNRDDVDSAIDYLRQAVHTAPWRASAHMVLAIAYARAARREEVLRELREAVRLDPSLLARAREAPALRAVLTRRDFEQLATATAPASPAPP